MRSCPTSEWASRRSYSGSGTGIIQAQVEATRERQRVRFEGTALRTDADAHGDPWVRAGGGARVGARHPPLQPHTHRTLRHRLPIRLTEGSPGMLRPHRRG